MPVHVLPKMEYQLSYGVECLTSSEACQLWTETLLHSSTVSYIGKTLITVAILLFLNSALTKAEMFPTSSHFYCNVKYPFNFPFFQIKSR